MTAFIHSHFPIVMIPAYQCAAGIGKDCKAIVAKMRNIFFYYSTFLLNDKTFFNLKLKSHEGLLHAFITVQTKL